MIQNKLCIMQLHDYPVSVCSCHESVSNLYQILYLYPLQKTKVLIMSLTLKINVMNSGNTVGRRLTHIRKIIFILGNKLEKF